MGLEKLTDGAIMVEPEDAGELEELHHWSMKEISDQFPNLAAHGLIYQEKVNPDGSPNRRLIHSQFGERQMGVRSKPLEQYLSPNERVLGEVFVFALKEKKVNERISAVASRWDPHLTRDQAKKRPRDDLKRTVLPTPMHMRRPEATNEAEMEKNFKYILYRAFRAYVRNHTPYTTQSDNLKLEAQPLSKKRGASCSDFVAYSTKVALIESIFPKGLPPEMKKSMDAIEAYKKEHHLTKLESVKDDLFDTFVNDVMRYVPEDDPHLEQLATPLKGTGIQFFSANAFDSPDVWEFKGYLCYVPVEGGSQKMYKPFVMDHDTYQKIITENGGNMHQIVVNEDELKKIGVLLPEEEQTQKLKM